MPSQPTRVPGDASARRLALGRALDLGSLSDLHPSTAEQRRARRLGWTHRTLLTDLTVAVGVGLGTALPLLHRGVTAPRVWLLQQLLVLPLVWRRRQPSLVFTVIALAASVQWLVGERLPADAALLVALYTVAAREPRGRAVAAAGLLELGVVLASLRFAPTGDGTIGSLVFLSGMVTAAFLLGTSLQTRTAYLAGLEERAHRLETERDQQAQLAQVAERTRIAREMHDIVAHNLSVMIALSAGAAATTTSDPLAAAAVMTQVADTGRSALQEMRQLLGFLRDHDHATSLTPLPGLAQLPELAEQLRRTGMTVRSSVEGQPRPLPETTQLTVFRIVQEATTNVLKHGQQVSVVKVRVVWTDTHLQVHVADDGTSVRASRPAGMGLVGMRERVRAAGGTVTAGPRPGGGWRVDASLPLPVPAPL
jgi:signal transduction histidine kinase